jgi:hypothetical protein
MDHQRTISLQCPTCGSTDFDNGGSEDLTATLTCTTCNRETTREQLIEDNAEHIESQKQELLQEATAQIKKDFEKQLRDAFRGKKYIKIK